MISASETNKKVLVVTITGRLDTITSVDFDKKLTEFIEKGNTKIILDVEKMDYISSQGLRSILIAAKKIKEKTGVLAVAALRGHPKEVFAISGFDTLIRVYYDKESALNDLGG
jgi:anti-sigma B factor antagonist